MKLEDINIDIECAVGLESKLTKQFLKEIHSRYCNSIEQVFTLLSSPLIMMTFAMTKVKETHLSIENAVKLGSYFNKPPQDPKDAAKHLIDFFKDQIEKANVNVYEEAIKEANSLYKKSNEIRDCFTNIGLNALVNSWTLFESFSKDIWISCLNKYPQLLNQKVVNSKIENESEILGKTIPIHILSKYNYNISNHLGEILSQKYEFTRSDGIKKAYKDLLNLEEGELQFLTHESLNQLEISRHILVHNSGIIDSKYLSRSKKNGELINTKLTFTIDEVNAMINTSIYSINEILLLADRINCN
jgi:hypothetical protein